MEREEEKRKKYWKKEGEEGRGGRLEKTKEKK